MPNGGDRNFIRLCAAINGFRLRYGVWPTAVRLYPNSIENLRDHVLGPEAFKKVEDKISFIPDKAPFVAEDDKGHSYSYGIEGFPKGTPDIEAGDWLGVRPLPESYWE